MDGWIEFKMTSPSGGSNKLCNPYGKFSIKSLSMINLISPLILEIGEMMLFTLFSQRAQEYSNAVVLQ